MAKDKTYADYLKALKGATESRKNDLIFKPNFNVTVYDQASYKRAGGKGKMNLKSYKMLGIKNEDEYFKARSKATKAIDRFGTKDYLKRRSVLSGASSALAKAGKRTVIGRLADTILKVGSGAGAGYAFAKKDEIKKKDVKKAKDGMMVTKGGDYIKDLID